MAKISRELKELSKLAEAQLKLEHFIIECETELETAKRQLRALTEETFPEKMEEFELTDITIKGNKIELLNDFRCNFPSLTGIERAKGDQKKSLIKRKLDGIKWLKDNDHTGLLKSKITFEFGMGEEKMLEKFRNKIDNTFPLLESANAEAIHPATLKKFLKELGEEGIEYPKETFGVSPYKRVEITVEEK